MAIGVGISYARAPVPADTTPPSPHDIVDDAAVLALARGLRRVAVLGIKTEAQSDQAAYYVPRYLVDQGIEIVPVPVYYPNATQILDRPVVRDLKEVSFASGPVDAVIVFRRGSDVPGHIDDLLALHPKLVWMQLGITSATAAQRLITAGIDVIQDRCVMVEHRRALSLGPA